MTPALRSVFLPAVLAAAGGSPAGPRMVKVSGTVTFDGKPVPQGDILFVPALTKYGPTASKIKDGRYETTAMEGTARVEINAAKRVFPAGPKNPDIDSWTEVDYIPEKYNRKSELTVKVGANGSDADTFDFDLKAR